MGRCAITKQQVSIVVFACLLLILFFILTKATSAQAEMGRLVTVYDRGEQKSFVTKEKTLGDALRQEAIELDTHDLIEPGLDEELVAPEYKVNIYRARPVTVIDGDVRIAVMSPYQTPGGIVKDADITFYNEDKATISQSTNVLADGAGLQLVIDRATVLQLDLYGKFIEARTQAATVGAMLQEKGVALGAIDRVSLPLDTAITPGMKVRVWREGKQTITLDEPLPFGDEKVYDADRPLGYRQITSIGTPGVKAVTYEIEIKDGQEVARKEIASVATKQPVKQTLTIGIKGLGSGLTRNKGAIQFTDSRGITHRETYYDLDMGVVMQSCGQGGRYSVRFDGAKIDADGYIIIAANYGRYPKCTVVETSMGPGKVYDTGGFALRHPEGFDLATDWTNGNGR